MKIEGRPRILFGLKPEWKPGTEASARRAGMRAGMQRLDEAELDHHDAVVPLTLQDQAILEARRANGSAIPALFVPAAQRDLCHDKRRFGHFMAQSGFGDHVPRELDANELRAADFPLVVKARHSEYGHRSFIVRDDGELDEHRPALAAGESFLQELIPGDEEYAVHVLLRDGMMVFAAAMHYRMNTANLVKGVHNRPVLRAWLPSAPLKPLWHDVLSKLGIISGTVCIDYRLRGGRAVIFEINPRVGSSLAARMETYLAVYLSSFGGRTPLGSG